MPLGGEDYGGQLVTLVDYISNWCLFLQKFGWVLHKSPIACPVVLKCVYGEIIHFSSFLQKYVTFPAKVHYTTKIIFVQM